VFDLGRSETLTSKVTPVPPRAALQTENYELLVSTAVDAAPKGSLSWGVSLWFPLRTRQRAHTRAQGALVPSRITGLLSLWSTPPTKPPQGSPRPANEALRHAQGRITHHGLEEIIIDRIVPLMRLTAQSPRPHQAAEAAGSHKQHLGGEP
jgi:hypothetical protein